MGCKCGRVKGSDYYSISYDMRKITISFYNDRVANGFESEFSSTGVSFSREGNTFTIHSTDIDHLNMVDTRAKIAVSNVINILTSNIVSPRFNNAGY